MTSTAMTNYKLWCQNIYYIKISVPMLTFQFVPLPQSLILIMINNTISSNYKHFNITILEKD